MKKDSIGDRIVAWRKIKGMTQGQLAEATEMSPSYISLIESGKRTNPSIEQVRSIVQALGCKTMREFYGGDLD